jgi:predicted nucleic acid-binding protein
MKYLFDSNTVSDLYDDATVAYHAIVSRLEQLLDTDEVYVSILTVYEFEYRFAKAPTTLKPRIREQITAMRKDFALLPLSETGAEIFGELKNQLQTVRGMKSENLKKHTVDLMLAANAIAAPAVLISADRLFADLQLLNAKLYTENWSVR